MISVTGGLGATPGTPYDPLRVESLRPQADGRFAERLARIGDIDGDGVNEILVGVPSETVGDFQDAGRVYLLSGKSRAVIYAIQSPENQRAAQFGFAISVLGDVNGDKKDDFAVGTDAHDVYTGTGTRCETVEPNGCNEEQGRAWVFSGASGDMLYQLDNPNPQPHSERGERRARFGSRIGRAGDLNGDGRSEVIVGASHNDIPGGCGSLEPGSPPPPLPAGCLKDQGQAFIFDGSAAGPAVRATALRTLEMPDPVPSAPGDPTRPSPELCAVSEGGHGPQTGAKCGTFGLAVQGPGDVDGDGITDQLVDAGSYNFYTGSGRPCGEPEPNGCNEGQGRMYLFSGKSGALVSRIDDPVPQPGVSFGFQDAAPGAPGDVTGDGRADLYGNGFDQDGPAGRFEGRAWVFDGKATAEAGTGVVRYTLRDPTPEDGGQFGWSLDKTDYNHDPIPDLYVGSSPHDGGGSQRGGTYVLDGADGSELKRLELPPGDVDPNDAGFPGVLGPNLGWGLAAPGDLNHDGEPDYLAGAPFMNVGGNRDQGRMYAFLSRVPPRAPPAGSPGSPRSPSSPGTGGSPVVNAKGCLNFRAGVRGRRLGPARLGGSRAPQRRAFKGARRRSRGGIDRYCIAGGGALRIGYPTRRLNRTLARSLRRRVKNRAVLVLTSSRRYSIAGIRRGTRVRTLRRRLRGERRFRVGRDVWYLADGRGSRRLFKTRGGRVLEVGIADKRLTHTHTAQRRLLRAWQL